MEDIFDKFRDLKISHANTLWCATERIMQLVTVSPELIYLASCKL